MKVPAQITGLLVTAILTASILTSCATQQTAVRKTSKTISHRTAGQDISGDWHVADSTARFRISFVDGNIHIEGWDSSTGEKFRISDVRWDGRRLHGIFVLPSKKRTTFSHLVLIDPDTLKGPRTGDGFGEEVWMRESIRAAAALTGFAMQQKADAKPAETVSGNTAGQDISGDWHVVDSTARFRISFIDGNIHIEGWDSSDGERFRISDVHWDGKRLKGIFIMPSTNGTTYSNLLLTDANTLKGTYRGDSSGVEMWKRH
jgi:hypothetical protein